MIEQVDLLEEGLRPLKRLEYDKLVELGVFEDEKIELLYGRLVPMSPQKSPHAESVTTMGELLGQRLGVRARVRIQAPLALSATSEPEPDVAVVPPGRYWDEHPTSAWLTAEVAESSARKDRHIKARLYAECDVLEYWLVDLTGDLVEVFREPSDGVYRNSRVYRRGESIALIKFPDVTIAVDEILPPLRKTNGNGSHE